MIVLPSILLILNLEKEILLLRLKYETREQYNPSKSHVNTKLDNIQYAAVKDSDF